jgi:hypothetical protein
MDLTGRIIAVLPASSGVSQRTGNPWMSQDYVIEVPGQFPRKCVFRVFGEDRIKLFNIQMGEDLTIQFDIDAHEFNGRWFNDIRAFNVVRGAVPVAAAPGAPVAAAPGAPVAAAPEAGAAPFPPQQPVAPAAETAPFPPAQEPAGDGSTDDLPF